MKFTTALSSIALLAVAANATPVRRDAPTDVDILNFALTLEYLENAFYAGGLAKFTNDDFVKAGLPTWAYGRIQQIRTHEDTHVKFLQTALGSAATQACEYSFPYTDPLSFVTISHALETVGTSAYVGAAKFIKNEDYLLAAATILSTEARQSGWVESALRKGAAWSGPFETPLDLNQVFTIASSFITKCPDSNPKLPVTAYPALSVTSASAVPGQKVDLKFALPDGFDKSTPLFGVFLSGQNALVSPLDGTSVTIPGDLLGTTYLIISSDSNGVDDSKTVAGPAMLEFAFDSNGKFEQLPF